jgi:hypothetical protein
MLGKAPFPEARHPLARKVRPVRPSSLPVSRGSEPSGSARRSLRGYGTDDAQTSCGNGASSLCTCEEQWADSGCDCDPRVGCVSEYSEKAWLSRAERAAGFKIMLGAPPWLRPLSRTSSLIQGAPSLGVASVLSSSWFSPLVASPFASTPEVSMFHVVASPRCRPPTCRISRFRRSLSRGLLANRGFDIVLFFST